MVGFELARGFAGVAIAVFEIYPKCLAPFLCPSGTARIALELVDDWFSLPPETLGLGDFIDARFVGWLAWCILSLPYLKSDRPFTSQACLYYILFFFSLVIAGSVCVKSEVASTLSVSYWSHICGESIYHIVRSSSDRPFTATAVLG